MDINSAKDNFISSFKLSKNGFQTPTNFVNEFGLSVSKNRIQNNREFASLYKFFIAKNILDSKDEQKPIWISVSYGEKLLDGSINLTPEGIKRKISWPIDLESRDEFFYNLGSNKFFDKKGQEISAEKLLLKIECLHLKPTKFFKGFFLKLKLIFYRLILTNILKALYYFLMWFLYILSGTKTKNGIWLIHSKLDKFDENKEIKKEIFAAEKINIFGYQASAWSVVVYSLIHFIAYSFWYFYLNTHAKIEFLFIKTTFRNSFLVITYAIPSLVFFEHLIPRIFEYIIMSIGTLFHKVSFKKIKI